jgi:2-polyprenyl-6-methoxyphenol hydroxylase-like FAD-dependent oxidoreductase
MADRQLHVTIIGGGIAGLCLA